MSRQATAEHTSAPRFEDLHVGLFVPERRQTLDQARLLRYAGASGDFNPLHWDSGFARHVSPTGDVIAHGMLNAGVLAGVIAEWAGGADRVRRFSVSFRAPCPVGSTVAYGGEVIDLDERQRTATLAVWAELSDGGKVIDRRRSRAVVQFDEVRRSGLSPQRVPENGLPAGG